ncbi:cartilage acidic protein 1 isoform X2 [Myotis myotis]|uniref:Cartilage acidic protein 1 n=2 Tax=Myotis myotis TaxID=51298 RepID=A0A7J7TSM5_MYOMY|nr:cartilage acidic protein 1 isoform X2 [Myotis myotis]XP_036192302.1 cartilage acidic protein 1 isoform X2 [Myotis myotis]KAF6303598.1 cartilage acidic protein 1 [Myotis myotis]
MFRMFPFLLLLWFLAPTEGSQRAEPMFTAVTNSVLPPDYDSNPTQLNYGVAVTDVDDDGDFEIVVAGYNGPNLVLKYDRAQKRLVNIAVDKRSSPYYALRDRQGNAIGVTACDIDGDGREEIYFLNTNNAFSGVATYTDKLFKFRNNRWEDILSDEVNVARGVASLFAGRSVACVDRTGSGRYSIYIANYAYGNVGPDALIEMDPEASDLSRGILALRDVAAEAGVSKYTGGRGVSVGPILSSSASDIFCDNENGPNFLFHNRGDGTFVDAAASAGVDDPHQHGRGVALADFNRDGKVDIVYGNWNGPHRLYLQMSAHGKVRFRDIASPKFSMPSPVRTVIAADFDNDQELEIFFNNFAHRSSSANRLFRVIRREHGDPLIEELNPGDALEPEGRGTGGVVTDFDGDGMLDLILSHGESMAQPLSVFRGNQGFNNNWLRVVPRTRFGAFARGAKVVLYTKQSGAHLRIIDGGSGYLCEMEPVAHFGLGKDEASSVEVTWPDGKVASRNVASGEMNSVLEIPYPRDEDRLQDPAPLQCGQGFSQQENGHCMDTNECIQFPFVCPRDKPVCVNTYGSYRCRTNKKCSRGYEPNEDGTACVAQVAFLGGYPSAAFRISEPLSRASYLSLGLGLCLQFYAF